MMAKQNFLIVTTDNDVSLNLFFSDRITTHFNILTVQYGEDGYLNRISQFKPDSIYFRDPFTSATYDSRTVQQTISTIYKQYPDVTYVDDTKEFADILFEDKWEQYRIFSDIMPKTTLYSPQSKFIEGRNILKKRISSRGKQVFFTKKTVSSDEYIVQELLAINSEYRVYVVNGTIVNIVGIRISKTPESKVKLVSCSPIPADVRLFTEALLPRLQSFNLIGLDIARTKEQRLLLIEVNRSCQFNRFYVLTHINLAELLLEQYT